MRHACPPHAGCSWWHGLARGAHRTTAWHCSAAASEAARRLHGVLRGARAAAGCAAGMACTISFHHAACPPHMCNHSSAAHIAPWQQLQPIMAAPQSVTTVLHCACVAAREAEGGVLERPQAVRGSIEGRAQGRVDVGAMRGPGSHSMQPMQQQKRLLLPRLLLRRRLFVPQPLRSTSRRWRTKLSGAPWHRCGP